MRYEVTQRGGQSVTVEAVDWMMAMSQAISLFGIEVSGWMCATRPDGTVNVIDPMSGQSWLVKPVEDDQPVTQEIELPPPEPSAPKRPRPAPKPPPSVKPTTMWSIPPDEVTEEEPPGVPPPDDLAEQLFDLSTDLFVARNLPEAASMALDLLMKLIPCEAGSVLRGSRKEAELTFVACAGPAAKQLLGKKMNFGQGVVGACFDLGITILVHDVSQDTRHLDRFDKQTGFQTRSVLCVPLTQALATFGAIELINPEGRFQDWHVEAMETVARTLTQLITDAQR